MGPFVGNHATIQWLRDRWKGDLVNRIVIALNEGREIQSVLGEVPQNPEVPSVAGRLDLRGINFSHQNLRGPWEMKGEERVRGGVNLRDVDLTGAILSWVILPRADLRRAILKDVDLRNAELIYSDLSDADLTGVEMQGAWLLNTKFYGAKITKEQLKSRRNLGQLDFDYLAYEI